RPRPHLSRPSPSPRPPTRHQRQPRHGHLPPERRRRWPPPRRAAGLPPPRPPRPRRPPHPHPRLRPRPPRPPRSPLPLHAQRLPPPRQRPQNAPHSDSGSNFATITLPAHPYVGQRLLVRRELRGTRGAPFAGYLEGEAPHGGLLQVPIEWTDRAPP